MLKIFISSTFRDLKTIRTSLILKIAEVFKGIGMENFIPDGSTSHSILINNLKKSDIVIFLISSYYGSIIKECNIKDCHANCLMKQEKQKISYTECEYYVTLSEKKPHMTFLFDYNWNLILELDPIKKKKLEKKDVIKFSRKYDLEDSEILHYFKVRKKVLKFKKAISEFYKYLKFPENRKDVEDILSIISCDLAENIFKWYNEGMISFKNFVGRRDILLEIKNKFKKTLEVSGVGGIGKTSLIQIFLLIQKLKGFNIQTIGINQSYSSGSGYYFFREKCKQFQYIISSETIGLNDILDALLIERDHIIRKTSNSNIIEFLIEKLNKSNHILFIDDFQYADNDLVKFVKSGNNIIIATRKKFNISRNEIELKGLNDNECEYYLKLLEDKFGKKINLNIKTKIKKISEGHPIIMEILLRNFEKINFDNYMDLRQIKEVTSSKNIDELFDRLIKEILSKRAFRLLEYLSILNIDRKNNIDIDLVMEVYIFDNFQINFNELIDSRLIKKTNQEGIYTFTFRHIRDIIYDEEFLEGHQFALNYYDRKKRKYQYNMCDDVEYIYHALYADSLKLISKQILIVSDLISPNFLCFKRLLYVLKHFRYLENDKCKIVLLVAKAKLHSKIFHYKIAEELYQKALNLTFTLINNQNDLEIHPAMIKRNLGLINYQLDRVEKAKFLLNDALELLRKYNLILPNLIEYYRALIFLSYGILYQKLREFQKSENLFLKSKKILKNLKNFDSDFYLDDITKNLVNLGNQYRLEERFNDSEKVLFEALHYRKKLFRKYPNIYLPKMANIYNSFGSLLWNKKENIQKAIQFYNKALVIYKCLSNKDNVVYKFELARTLNALGVAYRDIEDFNRSMLNLKESLKIYKELSSKNPDLYISEIGRTELNLGQLCYKFNNFREAKHHIKEASQIFLDLSLSNPKIYLPRLLASLVHYGNIYFLEKKSDNALKFYNLAFHIYSNSTIIRKNDYREEILELCNNLAIINNNKCNYLISIYLLSKSLKIIRNFKKEEESTQLGELEEQIIQNLNKSYYLIFNKIKEKFFLTSLKSSFNFYISANCTNLLKQFLKLLVNLRFSKKYRF